MQSLLSHASLPSEHTYCGISEPFNDLPSLANAISFNVLDVVSGLAIIAVCFLLVYRRVNNKIEKLIIGVYALGGLGGLLAAIYELPSSHALNIYTVRLLLHITTSLVNVIGLLAAITLVVLVQKRRGKVLGLYALYIAFSIAAALLVHTTFGAFMQRAQITITGAWIVLVPILFLQHKAKHIK